MSRKSSLSGSAAKRMSTSLFQSIPAWPTVMTYFQRLNFGRFLGCFLLFPCYLKSLAEE